MWWEDLDLYLQALQPLVLPAPLSSIGCSTDDWVSAADSGGSLRPVRGGGPDIT